MPTRRRRWPRSQLARRSGSRIPLPSPIGDSKSPDRQPAPHTASIYLARTCTDGVRALRSSLGGPQMANLPARNDRIELRATEAEKRLIAEAAAQEQLDITRFIMRSVLP